MCGIVGYIGNKEAYPIIIKGLKKLEYRGYDSAGIALINSNNKLNTYKTKGKVSYLEEYVKDKDLSGYIGIAHTRWATHGEPNSTNAHPHCSSSGELAIVHNGIIENYSTIKSKLEGQGFSFKSSTDTEVLVQLIEFIKETNHIDLLSSLQLALKEVIGAYAIAIIDKEKPDEIFVAKKSSPLVIGIGEDEYFLGSDITPIIEYTNKVIYLKDEEIGILRKGKELKIVNLNNTECHNKINTVSMKLGEIEKSGFPHFMLKEIFEQPSCLKDCMRGRVYKESKTVTLSSISEYKEKFINARRITIVACGTSWHAGLIGKLLIENLCQIPVTVEYASEFRYNNPVIEKDEIVIAISQSGETADTLAAIELAKEKGAFIYGICNTVGSSIARVTHTGSYIHVGPEIGVASTKAFTGQVTILTMMALCIAKERNSINQSLYKQLVEELESIPDKMTEILNHNDMVSEISKTFTYAKNFIYLGRGYSFPIALEGALKLKEISYIHAEGYPAAEMKHGPIALIDSDMPVVVIATKNKIYNKIVSNIQEIKSRKGKVIAIITEGDEDIKSIADISIELPEINECLSPLITSLPIQLLAYHIAICKGIDVDKPRNLAKSVTVE